MKIPNIKDIDFSSDFMMGIRRSVFIGVLFLFISIFGGIMLGIKIANINFEKNKQANTNIALEVIKNKIADIVQSIEKIYVSDVDVSKLINFGLKDLLERLDSNSSYIDAISLADYNQAVEENRDGIGIVFLMSKGLPTIISPLYFSSSDEAGLKSGDVIVKIDDEDLSQKSYNEREISTKLLGVSGSKISLSVKRRGEKEIQNFCVTRAKNPQGNVYHTQISDDLGYIKIAFFSLNSSKDFFNALSSLIKQGVKKIIIDLRSNPGGDFDEAIAIAERLLPKGQLICSLKGKSEVYNNIFYSKNKDDIDDVKFMVIVDNGTAASAELLAGALQDNDRAIIVGTSRTFGRCIVRHSIIMQDGSQLLITAGKYYTPSGRSLYRSSSSVVDDNFLFEQYRHVGYFRADSLATNENIYHTLSGRTVIGGGGIVPDFFIVCEENKPILFEKLMPIMKIIAKEYANQNYSTLSKLKIDHFIKNFEVPNIVVDQIKMHAEQSDELFDDSLFRSIKPLLKNRLKAYIALHIWKESAFLKLVLSSDEVFQKSIKIFNGDNYLNEN